MQAFRQEFVCSSYIRLTTLSTLPVCKVVLSRRICSYQNTKETSCAFSPYVLLVCLCIRAKFGFVAGCCNLCKESDAKRWWCGFEHEVVGLILSCGKHVLVRAGIKSTCIRVHAEVFQVIKLALLSVILPELIRSTKLQCPRIALQKTLYWRKGRLAVIACFEKDSQPTKALWLNSPSIKSLCHNFTMLCSILHLVQHSGSYESSALLPCCRGVRIFETSNVWFNSQDTSTLRKIQTPQNFVTSIQIGTGNYIPGLNFASVRIENVYKIAPLIYK